MLQPSVRYSAVPRRNMPATVTPLPSTVGTAPDLFGPTPLYDELVATLEAAKVEYRRIPPMQRTGPFDPMPIYQSFVARLKAQYPGCGIDPRDSLIPLSGGHIQNWSASDGMNYLSKFKDAESRCSYVSLIEPGVFINGRFIPDSFNPERVAAAARAAANAELQRVRNAEQLRERGAELAGLAGGYRKRKTRKQRNKRKVSYKKRR